MADNPSSTSRFRFRDHQETDSSDGHTSSDSSCLSSDADDDFELESMTGTGIKHLCSELLELKSVSDEDFHKNIFSNYSAFIRIFEEVEAMENELVQLKQHISTQKRLVEDLKYGIFLKVLSKELVESTEEPGCDGQPSRPSILEAHANDVAEILDVLLSERRLDEALTILEMEARTFQSMQLEENIPSNVLISYKSAISERKAMIADQLTGVAENPRVSAPELQKALVKLHRLGDSHLATQLLFKYYHSRIASGIYDLQYSKTILHGVYIREVAKFVFSMISQAARCFTVLYGETSPYASELIQWACEETEVFAACFSRYVKSISETSGGLLTAVEAVQFATSYCSLLETQRIVLKPCLVKLIRPCMEEVLQIHIDHFKKVIGIFTSTDNWVVGRYLVSGTLTDECSSMVIGQQPEFYLLTNSGRKFVTLLQAITEDVSPLVALKMEGQILRGLMDLFTEYIVILERALTSETNVIEKSCSRISLAESPAQQISVIVNLSTLVHLFSSIITNFFRGINHFSFEVDNFKIFIQEASDRVRVHFCKQFICRTISHEGVYRLKPEPCVSGQSDSNMLCDAMPSVAFQELFLELRNLEKLAEDSVVELDWLMDLLEELMETIFVWISNNKEIWTITEEDLTAQHSGNFKQFVLDIQFLVEIARRGGYCSDNIMIASLDLVSRMETTFVSAGLDPKRTREDVGLAINAATKALQKLEELEEAYILPNEPSEHLQEETSEHLSMVASDSFKDDDAMSSSEKTVKYVEDSAVVDVSEVASNADSDISKIELEGVNLQRDGGFDDEDAINSVATSLQEQTSEHLSLLANDSLKDDDTMSCSEKAVKSVEDSAVIDVSEVVSNADSDISKMELEGVNLQRDGGFDDEDAINSVATSVQEQTSEHLSLLANDSLKDDDAMSSSEKSVKSVEDSAVINVSEVASNADSDISKIELEGVKLQRDADFDDDDDDAINSVATCVQLEDTSENAAYAAGAGKLQKTKLLDMQLSVGNVGEASGAWVYTEDETSSQHDDSSRTVYKLEECIQTELPATGGDIDKLRLDIDKNSVEKDAALILEDCDKK